MFERPNCNLSTDIEAFHYGGGVSGPCHISNVKVPFPNFARIILILY